MNKLICFKESGEQTEYTLNEDSASHLRFNLSPTNEIWMFDIGENNGYCYKFNGTEFDKQYFYK